MDHRLWTMDFLQIDLSSLYFKCLRLCCHACAKRIFFAYTLRAGKLPYFLRDLHRAEMRAAHGTEVRDLGAFCRQCFIVVRLRSFRIQRKVELIFPAELKAGLAQGVVTVL